jgi:hypothetical protein
MSPAGLAFKEEGPGSMRLWAMVRIADLSVSRIEDNYSQ